MGKYKYLRNLFKGIDHHMINTEGGAMDIGHVHDGKFDLGHIDVPFTVGQNDTNTLMVDIGGLIDGVPFVGINIHVSKAGEIEKSAETKGGHMQTNSFGNVITGRTGKLR